MPLEQTKSVDTQRELIIDNRVQGINTLSRTGNKRFVSAFLHALRSPHPRVRAAGARALGRLWTHGTTQVLISKLWDRSIQVRAAAVKSLGNIGDRSAVPHLSKMFRNAVISARKDFYLDRKTSALREALVMALRKLMGRDGFDHFVMALKDPYAGVRALAAQSLKKINDPRAIPYLFVALVDEARHNGLSAISDIAAAMGSIGGGRGMVPEIITLLRDRNVLIRLGAVLALGEIGDKRAVMYVIPMLQDKYIKGEAIRTLGQIGDMRAVQPLIKMLSDKNPKFRRKAAIALGRLGSIEAWSVLNDIANNDEYGCVRRAARLAKKAVLLSIGARYFINPLLSILTFGCADRVFADPEDL